MMRPARPASRRSLSNNKIGVVAGACDAGSKRAGADPAPDRCRAVRSRWRRRRGTAAVAVAHRARHAVLLIDRQERARPPARAARRAAAAGLRHRELAPGSSSALSGPKPTTARGSRPRARATRPRRASRARRPTRSAAVRSRSRRRAAPPPPRPGLPAQPGSAARRGRAARLRPLASTCSKPPRRSVTSDAGWRRTRRAAPRTRGQP